MCFDSNRSLYGLPTSPVTNTNNDCTAPLCHSNRLATTDVIFHTNTDEQHTVYNSTCSISSSNGSNSCDRQKILFFGFEESWERDLWSAWLVKVSRNLNEKKRLSH